MPSTRHLRRNERVDRFVSEEEEPYTPTALLRRTNYEYDYVVVVIVVYLPDGFTYMKSINFCSLNVKISV